MKLRIEIIIIVINLIIIVQLSDGKRCRDLLVGQYKCKDPEIDSKLQTEKGCRKNHTVLVPCFPVQGVNCDSKDFSGDEIGFYRELPCRYVTGKSFETALYLSIFLGCFGIDRFYLGYPAIGKTFFCTKLLMHICDGIFDFKESSIETPCFAKYYM